MRRFIGGRFLNGFLAFLLLAGVWLLLAELYPPSIVPSMTAVGERLWDILRDGKSRHAVVLTLWRLLAGLGIGVVGGMLVGLALGYSRFLRGLCRPLLGLVQAVPPVSWLVLALIWFGFDGRPSVFIVALSALPVMALNLVEGIAGIDPRLMQMGTIYRFSRWKKLRFIVLPSVLPSVRSGLQVAAGLGCKGVVMGEVLTTDSGIGGAITDARLNIEPEGVVAWTLVMVGLYYLLDRLLSLSLRRGGPPPC